MGSKLETSATLLEMILSDLRGGEEEEEGGEGGGAGSAGKKHLLLRVLLYHKSSTSGSPSGSKGHERDAVPVFRMSFLPGVCA